MRSILFLIAIIPLWSQEPVTIRVGHFPNLTHAQALIGQHLTETDQGWFEERLGPDVKVEWYIYNAGPSAMEAILTESIDLTYVGPSPSINAYVRSKGEEVRIIAGACSGGAALVVHDNGSIKTNADFKGKKMGTPQFGNTQDIAARAWLESQGFKITMTGGDVLVIPTSAANQFLLFKTKELDAVWTIEPWVSRLILEAQGRLYFEESVLWPKTNGKYVTTHLVARKNFLTEKPDLVRKWLLAHVELTDWINENPDDAKQLVNLELKRETRIAISPTILDHAWKNFELTYDPVSASLFRYAEEAFRMGFLKTKPELKGIYELGPLNSILKESGKKQRYE